MATLGNIRQRLFGISLHETSCEKRGFSVSNPVIKERLETIGQTFVFGYHNALLYNDSERIAEELNRQIDRELQGFAFEGAAMGLMLLDILSLQGPRRLQQLVNTCAHHHFYMLHVGAGWAMARLPWRIQHRVETLDGVCRWLALDGFGFHQGYFHAKQFVYRQQRQNNLTGYALRAFDQGLGRSLWFVLGSDVGRISSCIQEFSAQRQADLWSGIGLASSYAGGLSEAELTELNHLSGGFSLCLAQGAAFAAKARQRADNPIAHTDLACKIFCFTSADVAANICDQALVDLPADAAMPSYEIWRQRIQHHLAMEAAA